jgi:hypothetical protein
MEAEIVLREVAPAAAHFGVLRIGCWRGRRRSILGVVPAILAARFIAGTETGHGPAGAAVRIGRCEKQSRACP